MVSFCSGVQNKRYNEQPDPCGHAHRNNSELAQQIKLLILNIASDYYLFLLPYLFIIS